MAAARQALDRRMQSRRRGAVFSADRRYRYLLWRRWSSHGRAILFVGLNPSTADADNDDPTIRRCIGFARRCGAGALLVANLFAFRATRPVDLFAAADPVGAETDLWLQAAVAIASSRVACWGIHGRRRDRAGEVCRLLGACRCFGTTAGGEPRHPLYLRGETPLVGFTPPGFGGRSMRPGRSITPVAPNAGTR